MPDHKQMTEAEMRDMDAQIAEKVMGYGWIEFDSIDYDRVNHKIRVLASNLFSDKDDVAKMLPARGNVSWHFLGVPCYTKDIAHAWSVVEKMRELGFAWQACQTWDGPDNDPKGEAGGWAFMHKDDHKYEREGESQIRSSECPVALAICRAAIAAIEAKKGQQL